jgi:hypothetical protein
MEEEFSHPYPGFLAYATAVAILSHSSYCNPYGLYYYYLLSWLYSPFVGPWPLFSFLILYTVGKAPWMGDQPVARHLCTHRINAHNRDIHTLSGI